ncbi:MAG TPA: M48 family metallopeptidase [Candidatus Sulfotelmatobacter sp.]|nr:M48 family metallopeptidase [Candidatus Sulfotelmatobacter sp.]
MRESRGRFSDGRTAASRPVALGFNDAALIIRADGSDDLTWPLADLRLLAPPARDGAAVLCRHGGDERLTCGDADFLAALGAAAPALRGDPYARSPWRKLALGLSALLLGGAVLFFLLLPRFASAVAAILPPSTEQRMGRWMVDPIAKQLRLLRPGKGTAEFCTGSGGQQVLQQLADRLAAGAALRYPLHMRVVNSSLINAFALPGGQIVVLRGLIDFAETPNELAGVLAHEIAHEDLHHPTRLVIERSAGGFLVGLVFGDVVGASALGGLAGALLGARYGRQAETQADAHGLELLARAGIDGAAWADLFDRLSKQEPHGAGAFSLLESHPPTPERAALIRRASRQGSEALDLASWRALKEICD